MAVGMEGWMKRSVEGGRGWVHRGVGRLREEAERPGEAALQGLLTCRLHISELQSSLILPSWVSEALPSLTECAACIYVCVCDCVCAHECMSAFWNV